MKCPICKYDVPEPKPGEPTGAFPFCSERCKLIDLGRWLGGKYQIPVADPDEEGRDVGRDEGRRLKDE
jgi:endogenous inhibitor of DNA gyrase (YacG/DUF329 family)